jgi:REP element-mobilizing transposase RayT
VTLRLRPGLPSLRDPGLRAPLEKAFAAAFKRFGCRLVHYSIQINHIHLIAEARDEHALSRAIKGLCVRLARRLNQAWRRSGRVFGVLRTPLEVRHALAYCLNNARKHGVVLRGLDPFSSGRWFDGWKNAPHPPPAYTMLARPMTWLLKTGWKHWDLIPVDEEPSARRTAAAIRRAKRRLEKKVGPMSRA